MELDGVDGHVQLLGDLVVGEPLGGDSEHLVLARRQDAAQFRNGRLGVGMLEHVSDARAVRRACLRDVGTAISGADPSPTARPHLAGRA